MKDLVGRKEETCEALTYWITSATLEDGKRNKNYNLQFIKTIKAFILI